jgi:polysaccharide biosynthesis/export protein
MLTMCMLACVAPSSVVFAAPAPEAAPPSSAPAAGSPIASYIIGPGDTLEVFVWRNPELSTKVPVRPDGKISTPLVEDMIAVGKTTTQLARDIETVLDKYVRSPKVNVIVSTALSAMSQVVVVGAAANPRAVPYREGLRVIDVIIAVGGLNEFAAGNRAKIVRVVNGRQQEIKVKLRRLLDNGDVAQNIVLQPGDMLVIPEKFF